MSLQKHQEENHLVGESLPLDHQLYCTKVLKAFLSSAVPLAKLARFKELLESNALRLIDRSHLANLIPFVLQEEHKLIKEEIRGKQVSAVYDGTT